MALSDNLVAYWPFDEGTGTSADDATGNGYNLSLTGTVSWPAGIIGNALTFGADGRYGASATGPTLSTKALSVARWVKTTGSNFWLWSFGIGGNYYAIGIDSSGHVQARVSSSAVQRVSDAVVNDGLLHHVCVIFPASGAVASVVIVVDGVVTGGSSVGTTWATTPSGVFYFNKLPTGFGGSQTVDECGVWTRELSSEEYLALYNSGSGLSYGEIIGGGTSNQTVALGLATETDSALPVASILTPIFSVDDNNNLIVIGPVAGDWDVGVNVADADGKVFFKTFRITIGAAASLLTTMILMNTSGSDLPANSITPIFGHLFQKGDVPSGQAPRFQLADGTNIPFSMSKQTKTHADGSLFHAAFMLRLPAGIPASSSLTINVLSGGLVPSASSRALDDFSVGSLDLNVTVTGLDNLSGDWSSNLNQGITANGADYQYMDGDAGAVWRVPAAFRQSGSDHGQLEGWWYVAALQDADGNLAGVRHLTRVTQPYYNVASPAPSFRSFSAIGIYDGGSLLADMMANYPAAAEFTWSSGKNLNAAAHGFEKGMLARLTTSGTLPAGLSAGQSYATYPTSADAFALGTDFNSVVANGTSVCIAPTDPGTGTHTCSLYPFISQFGSIWTAQENGRWNYAQGAGSVADDPTILVQPDMAYWAGSGALPSYDLGAYSPGNNPAYSYFPDTGGPVSRFISTTGERNDIGPLPTWYARHIFTRAEIDEQAVRVIGLVGGHLPICLRDITTKAIPVVNGTDYSGMPSHNSTFRWRGANTNYGGITAIENDEVITQGWSYLDVSHIPALSYYPYVLTGEPQFMDMVGEYANATVYSLYTALGTAEVTENSNYIGGSRNVTINGKARHGIFYGDDLLRAVAWPLRDLASAQILPDSHPENISYNDYFKDMLFDTYDGYNDYIQMLIEGADPYVTDNGLYLESGSGGGGVQAAWTMGYFIGANNLAYGLTKATSVLSFLNYILKWPSHLYNTFGAWSLPYYNAMARKNGDACQANSCHTPYITSDEEFAVYGYSVTWDAGTGMFILKSIPSKNYALENDDIFMWNGIISGAPPAGFSGNNVPYYAVNKSGAGGVGTTFQLSDAPGGTPMILTDTQAAAKLVFGMPATRPSGYVGDAGSFSASNYLANLTAHFGWAKAIGATVDASMLSDLQALVAGASGYVAAYEADPKYAMADSY